MGVWIMAALITVLVGISINVGFWFVSLPMRIAGGFFFGLGLTFMTTLAGLAVSVVVWGILLGGMYRMALDQIDGRKIDLGAIFSITDVLPNLALASLLVWLATCLGMLCLVVPGWIVAGVLMFSTPMVVDGRLGAVAALRQSWTTLKDQWLLATVLVLVLAIMESFGLLLCGVGFLFMLPLAILSIAVLYRDFFPRNGAPSKRMQKVADPEFGPIGVEPRSRERIPVWAWFVLAGGLLTPALLLGLLIAVVIGAVSFLQRGAPHPFPNVAAQRPNAVAEADVLEALRRFQDAQGAAAAVPNDLPLPGAQAAKPALEPPLLDEMGDLRKAMERMAQENGLRLPAPVQQVPRPGPIEGALPLADLNDKDEWVRRRALESLARSAPDPEHHDDVIKALGSSIHDGTPSVRAAAVRALAAWANADDVPALIVPLDDDAPEVRREAIRALGRVKDARAVQAVARHLADPDAFVSNDVSRLLRQFGPAAEREVDRYLMADDPRVATRACQILQSIGTSASIPALRVAAVGKSSAARAAQNALKAIASRERTKR
jgi:hypothetical protein